MFAVIFTEVLKDNCAILDKREVFIFFCFCWCHSAGNCCLFCVREVDLGSRVVGTVSCPNRAQTERKEETYLMYNIMLLSTLCRKIKWSKALEDEWIGGNGERQDNSEWEWRWNLGKSKRIVLGSDGRLRWEWKDAEKQASCRKN